MDFNPSGSKWRCCCCLLPSGLRMLAAIEVVAASVALIFLIVHMVGDFSKVTWFEVCLLLVTLFMLVGSALLFLGIQMHRPQLMYPTLFARGILIIFIQVFGVSTVLNPSEQIEQSTTMTYQNGKWEKQREDAASSNMALRLVGLVFFMLFVSILVFYQIYLIVRCIRYEKAYCRLERRRASLIHAGMIDPDYDCRRASSTNSAI